MCTHKECLFDCLTNYGRVGMKGPGREGLELTYTCAAAHALNTRTPVPLPMHSIHHLSSEVCKWQSHTTSSPAPPTLCSSQVTINTVPSAAYLLFLFFLHIHTTHEFIPQLHNHSVSVFSSSFPPPPPHPPHSALTIDVVRTWNMFTVFLLVVMHTHTYTRSQFAFQIRQSNPQQSIKVSHTHPCLLQTAHTEQKTLVHPQARPLHLRAMLPAGVFQLMVSVRVLRGHCPHGQPSSRVSEAIRRWRRWAAAACTCGPGSGRPGGGSRGATRRTAPSASQLVRCGAGPALSPATGVIWILIVPAGPVRSFATGVIWILIVPAGPVWSLTTGVIWKLIVPAGAALSPATGIIWMFHPCSRACCIICNRCSL